MRLFCGLLCFIGFPLDFFWEGTGPVLTSRIFFFPRKSTNSVLLRRELCRTAVGKQAYFFAGEMHV